LNSFSISLIGFTSSNYNDSNIRHILDALIQGRTFNEVKALYISRKAKKGEMNSHGIFSVQILGIHDPPFCIYHSLMDWGKPLVSALPFFSVALPSS